jgi:hypothetical protein
MSVLCSILFVLVCTVYANPSQTGDGCFLIVPNDPLTPAGLMTPWVLNGPNCNEANPVNARFVHGVVVNNNTGQLFIYNPLVISQGMAVVANPAPVNFTLGDHIVGLWLGSNSNFLTLTNDMGVAAGRCVTGPQGSPFGQFGWCNADRFWATVNQLINQGKITVPPLGKALDGQPCPTLRDFFIVDMDPDDGVQTLYDVTTANQVIQKTQNNEKMFQIKMTLANDGDHRLLTKFVNPAIGCNTLTIPDAADPGMNRPSDVMNIIQAILLQGPPVTETPNNDPMITTNGQPDLLKMNLYRLGVNQPQAAVFGGDNDPAAFCRNYANIAVARFKSLTAQLKNFTSPAAGFNTLFDFMKARAMNTWAAINCQALIGLPDPFAALV